MKNILYSLFFIIAFQTFVTSVTCQSLPDSIISRNTLKCFLCTMERDDSLCQTSIKECDSLLSIDRNCRLLMAKGRILYRYNNDAMGAYPILIEALPCNDDWLLYDLLGEVCSELGYYSEAITYFTKSIVKNKSSINSSYYERARCYVHLNKIQLALKDLNVCLKINPYHSEARVLRVMVNNELKSYTLIISDVAALEQQIKTLKYSPNEATLMYLQYYKAIALCAKKNFHEAIIQLTRFNSERHHEVLLTLRAFAKTQMKDYVGAIADCNEAEQIDNTKSDIYSHRGVSYLSLKNYENAILDFDKAIELSQDTSSNMFFPILTSHKLYKAGLYLNRGFAKLALEEYEDACLDWSRAGELGEKDAYKYIRKYCKDLYDEDSDYKNDE